MSLLKSANGLSVLPGLGFVPELESEQVRRTGIGHWLSCEFWYNAIRHFAARLRVSVDRDGNIWQIRERINIPTRQKFCFNHLSNWIAVFYGPIDQEFVRGRYIRQWRCRHTTKNSAMPQSTNSISWMTDIR